MASRFDRRLSSSRRTHHLRNSLTASRISARPRTAKKRANAPPIPPFGSRDRIASTRAKSRNANPAIHRTITCRSTGVSSMPTATGLDGRMNVADGLQWRTWNPRASPRASDQVTSTVSTRAYGWDVSKELSYTDLRYRCLPPERVHHEAEQGPRPPGVRLHDDGPCDRGARRHDWGRPREDEDP